MLLGCPWELWRDEKNRGSEKLGELYRGWRMRRGTLTCLQRQLGGNGTHTRQLLLQKQAGQHLGAYRSPVFLGHVTGRLQVDSTSAGPDGRGSGHGASPRRREGGRLPGSPTDDAGPVRAALFRPGAHGMVAIKSSAWGREKGRLGGGVGESPCPWRVTIPVPLENGNEAKG